MTIHLSKDLQQIVHDAMRMGGYSGEEAVIRAALTQLAESLPPLATGTKRPAKANGQPKPALPPASGEELYRRLMASGLLARLPDPTLDCDDDDEPVIEIKGEPLSETIIRERR